MKYIKTFEVYDPQKHEEINKRREMIDTKFYKGLSRIASFVDDLSRLDFRAASHSIVNKSGFRKLEYILNELECIKNFVKEGDKISLADLEEYEFDIHKIIEYLNSPEVTRYLLHDWNVGLKVKDLDDIVQTLETLDEIQQSQKRQQGSFC